ncbi:MAG: radical SAM protein, partial [Planctomycetota bacterium]
MANIRFTLVAFGCQMNKLDAELLEGAFRRQGWEKADAEGDADILLFLTCAVRKKPEEKVFARLSQVKKRNGRPILCVAGCMAQRWGQAILDRAGHVDLILGTHELLRGVGLIQSLLDGAPGPLFALSEEDALLPRDPAVRLLPHQAFIAVARGCSKGCAYCVVPAARGPARSRSIPDVVEEARDLLDAGVQEITLIAQSISGYGADLSPPSTLADLLRAVH